jgi:hypothetical protein
MFRAILRKYAYPFLFVSCIAVPYLANYELTFAVWAFTILVTLKKSYAPSLLIQMLCFAAILGIATVVQCYHDEYKAYYIIRDITYLVKPIMGLLIGYQLCYKNYEKGFQLLVYTGVFIAIAHLLVLLNAVVFFHARDLNTLREYGGYFSDYEVFVLVFLLFAHKFNLGISKSRLRIYILLVAVSALFYFARTNFIQFVIMYLALKGYFKITKKSITVLASVLLLIAFGYSAILSYNPKRNGPGIEAMLYKIKLAPIEAFKTKIDADDWKDFNDNYRSYENIHTVKQLSAKGTPTVLFGQGIGSRVDLKREVYLWDMNLRYISILHNGYMTVFLKSGIVGVLVYLYFIFLVLRPKKSTISINKEINLILLGLGVFLIFSTWVFTGVYNLLDSKSIVIGFLISYKVLTVQKLRAS